MKQFFVSVFFVGVFVGLVFLADNTIFVEKPLATPEPGPISTPVPTLEKLTKIEVGEDIYKYSLHQISDLSKLTLKPNFEQKMGSERIIENEECNFLVSGGFYSTENEPIGWFLSNGLEISEFERNSLLNGLLQVASSSAQIAKIQTLESAENGLQSGPLLIVAGEEANLSIKDDESRRRVVAATTAEEELVFIVVTGLNSLYGGPLLEELPNVIQSIGISEEIELMEAMNLDGGSASAFYSDQVKIRETSYIGSYFCLE